jgi:hypothetical protein
LVEEVSWWFRRHRGSHAADFRTADASAVIRDIGGFGYECYETFGEYLDAWEMKGGLKTVLASARLPGSDRRQKAIVCPTYSSPNARAGFVFDISSMSARGIPAFSNPAKKAASPSGCSGFAACPRSLARMHDLAPTSRIAFA